MCDPDELDLDDLADDDRAAEAAANDHDARRADGESDAPDWTDVPL